MIGIAQGQTRAGCHAAASRLSRPLPASPYAPGSTCLGFCSGGFLSPTSKFDAGDALGHGKCSAHDRWHSPSFVRVMSGEFDFPRIRVGVPPFPFSFSRTMSPAWLAPPFAPQRSRGAGELFNSCASASAFGRTSPRFVAITRCHCIASPRFGNATSRVAVATATVIPVATVTIITTKVPWSDRRRSWNSEIAIPKVPEAQECRVVLCEKSRAMTAIGTSGWDGCTYCLLHSYSTG